MNQTTAVDTVDRHKWATLKNSLFPGASDDSIRMVLSYCKARGLDPMKKPCHIVPMKVSGQWRDVVFPGIYELRTTAQKTGDYMGQDKAIFGDPIEYLGKKDVPSSCEVVVHRWHEKSQTRVSYPAEVYFSECAATTTDRDSGELRLNDRWSKAPKQMLEKCAEAAALRKAFPDELGGQMSAEEMYGATTGSTQPPPVGKPATEPPKSINDTDDEQPDDEPPESKYCTTKQSKLVQSRLDESGIPDNTFLRYFEIDHFDFLPFDRVDEALEWIRRGIEG